MNSVFFYQTLLEKRFHFEGDRLVSGKLSKVRLTKLGAGNATGEKLLMFVIGKSTKPS